MTSTLHETELGELFQQANKIAKMIKDLNGENGALPVLTSAHYEMDLDPLPILPNFNYSQHRRVVRVMAGGMELSEEDVRMVLKELEKRFDRVVTRTECLVQDQVRMSYDYGILKAEFETYQRKVDNLEKTVDGELSQLGQDKINLWKALEMKQNELTNLDTDIKKQVAEEVSGYHIAATSQIHELRVENNKLKKDLENEKQKYSAWEKNNGDQLKKVYSLERELADRGPKFVANDTDSLEAAFDRNLAENVRLRDVLDSSSKVLHDFHVKMKALENELKLFRAMDDHEKREDSYSYGKGDEDSSSSSDDNMLEDGGKK